MTTDLVVKVLAVIGGGVGGGLTMGLLAQLLMRALTVRQTPRWSLLVVRLFGGAICGWLVGLWLFGGGGPGIGGAGGWGFGSGSGSGANEKTVPTRDKDNEGKQTGDEKQTPDGETLRIEVLGRDALPEQDTQAERWYRIETKEGRQALTFAEVKEAVKKRQLVQPLLRSIEIVLYKDSPAEDKLQVRQLKMWAGDPNGGKMMVGILKEGADAPR